MKKELKNIPGLKEDEVVVIKKLGYGSLNMLRSLSTKASMGQRGTAEAVMDLGQYMIYELVLGIHEAPFFRGLTTIEEKVRFIKQDGVSAETGEYLRIEIDKFNGFGKIEEVKKKLD